MILSYQFKNFLSFKDNVEFSLCAPKNKVKKRFPDNYITSKNGNDILKTAVIVGENAGGKSNFVRSLEYFKSFFTGSGDVMTYRPTINTNNIKTSCPLEWNTEQSFEIELLIDGQLYKYYLELDASGIVSEILKLKNNDKQKYKEVLNAKRVELNVKCNGEPGNCLTEKCERISKVSYALTINNFDNKMKKNLKESAENKKQNGLFITKLSILGYEPAVQFTEWMKKKLWPESNVLNYDIYMQMKNEDDNRRILNDERYFEIFKMIDYSIIGIELDNEMPYTKTKVFRKNANGEIFSRELQYDSSGVREFFAWAVQIFRVVYENAVVFADEMDRVLNPILSDRIIAFINGKNHHGQFIFTTHNALHLDLKNYMKEQIYFITKDVENLESEMYSLADFPEIRYETTKIYEFYMKGILGGTAFE